jgi:hypothetical protein
MRQTKPMPRVSLFAAFAVVIPFLVVEAALIWYSLRHSSGWPGALMLFLAAIAGAIYFRTRRCPQCGGKLLLRSEQLPGHQYRQMLDCTRCDISWDTGHVIPESPE